MKNGKMKISYESPKLALEKSVRANTSSSSGVACHAGSIPGSSAVSANAACHAGSIPS